MSLDARIRSLKEKHRALDEKVERVEASAGHDDAVLSGLKKKRLAFRDEIRALEEGAEVS